MASDEESLKALEGLMTEFFYAETTNERKRKIEETLNCFSQQRNAWQHCLYYISLTQNQYVSMYCMNILENLINKQWIGIEAADKMQIRSMLTQFLMQHHKVIPHFLRNKLVKLVVDIGRLDWPHFYPEFFTNMMQVVQNPDTSALGLILLQTASEELANPREDLSMTRKEELHKLLLQQVPNILSILDGILQSILDKHRSMVTATPPPSPTQGQKLQSDSRRSPISSSPAQSKGLLSNMFKSPQNRACMETLPPLDPHAQELSLSALSCLSHLFSWIPLSSTITPHLLSTIFQFAVFGCEVSPARRGTNPHSEVTSLAQDSNLSLGVIAMGCINELLAKNCVPQEFEDFLLQMFQQTFYLLQRITKDSTTNTSGNRLAELDENYISKFTEFLRLFVSIHLRRFECNTQFPVVDFLSLLFKYTFKQANNEGLFACLDIWGVFLDYLGTRLDSRQSDAISLVNKYHEALLALVSEILHKIQFSFNQSQLDELDDETFDDDNETEWQHFLRQCLETIAKVSDLFPSDIFLLVYQPLQEYLDLYLGIEQFVVVDGSTQRLMIVAENECRKLHCSLRDLSSMLQALGCLAVHFIADHFMENFREAFVLLSKLVDVIAYGSRVRLYDVTSAVSNVLQADFVEVHAQALAAMKANASWLAQFFLESQNQEQQREQCQRMVTSVTASILPLIQTGVPEKIVQASAHLLLSVLTTVRAPYLMDLPCLQQFYSQMPRIELLNMEVQLLVYRSLSHYLLLPCPKRVDVQQEWEARAANHASLLAQLMAPFRLLKSNSALADDRALQLQAKPCVRRTMKILTDLVSTISVEGVSKSKHVCYMSIQEDVHLTLTLFPIYLNQSDVTQDILVFFLALFQGLRVQMGVPFTERTVQTFMNMFTREQLAEILLQENTTAYIVVEKFLQILGVIVQEPGAAFKSFHSHILTICMEQIYPLIAQRPSPDIKPTFYELLHRFLLHNWRHFFKGSVLKSLQASTEQVDNRECFIAIMQSFGQSFMQPDITLFRQNIDALESLNIKSKLYHRLMMAQFLNVLLQVLIVKSHDLLQEEIGITIYNMASVDFDSFYANFLPQFLQNCEMLNDTQKETLGFNFKMDKDLPSFTQNIQRLVNDLRFYQLCNSSLPEGSVKF